MMPSPSAIAGVRLVTLCDDRRVIARDHRMPVNPGRVAVPAIRVSPAATWAGPALPDSWENQPHDPSAHNRVDCWPSPNDSGPGFGDDRRLLGLGRYLEQPSDAANQWRLYHTP